MSAPLTEQGAMLTIEAACRTLRLPTIRDQSGPLAEAAVRDRLTHRVYLAEVLGAELDDREARRRERRIVEARFPRLKRLAEFDLGAAPSINPATPGRPRDRRLDRRRGTGRPPGRQRHREDASPDRARDGRLRAGSAGPVRHDRRPRQRAGRGRRRTDPVPRRRPYMHQAAVEDTYPDRDRLPDSPAGWFISLDARRVDQTYNEKVLEYETYLDAQLAAYRAGARGALTLDDLRARYQSHGDLLDAVTTVAHVVARLTRLDSSRTREILDNRFAALLLTQVSLELCLVIEDVLQRQILAGATLGALASRYPPGLSIALTKDQVTKLNTLASTPGSFDAAVGELLAGTAVTGFSRGLTDREADLAIAVLVRNKSAHGLERPGAAARQFDGIVPRLFFTLFAALEDLYR